MPCVGIALVVVSVEVLNLVVVALLVNKAYGPDSKEAGEDNKEDAVVGTKEVGVSKEAMVVPREEATAVKVAGDNKEEPEEVMEELKQEDGASNKAELQAAGVADIDYD